MRNEQCRKNVSNLGTSENGCEMEEGMEKYSTYHIKTEGFEQVLIGMAHMLQTVTIGTKCRVILDYDPALPKATIETFIDKSDIEKVQEKPFQWTLYDPKQQ